MDKKKKKRYKKEAICPCSISGNVLGIPMMVSVPTWTDWVQLNKIIQKERLSLTLLYIHDQIYFNTMNFRFIDSFIFNIVNPACEQYISPIEKRKKHERLVKFLTRNIRFSAALVDLVISKFAKLQQKNLPAFMKDALQAWKPIKYRTIKHETGTPFANKDDQRNFIAAVMQEEFGDFLFINPKLPSKLAGNKTSGTTLYRRYIYPGRRLLRKKSYSPQIIRASLSSEYSTGIVSIYNNAIEDLKDILKPKSKPKVPPLKAFLVIIKWAYCWDPNKDVLPEGYPEIRQIRDIFDLITPAQDGR